MDFAITCNVNDKEMSSILDNQVQLYTWNPTRFGDLTPYLTYVHDCILSLFLLFLILFASYNFL
jgi:hypothetical protein